MPLSLTYLFLLSFLGSRTRQMSFSLCSADMIPVFPKVSCYQQYSSTSRSHVIFTSMPHASSSLLYLSHSSYLQITLFTSPCSSVLESSFSILNSDSRFIRLFLLSSRSRSVKCQEKEDVCLVIEKNFMNRRNLSLFKSVLNLLMLLFI